MWILQASFLAATLTIASSGIVPFRESLVVPHIVAGEEAEIGQFPYQVAMFNGRLAFCGGSIISSKWVLTAGHCAYKSERFLIYVGAHNILRPSEKGRRVYSAGKAIVHEAYNTTTLQNDVAVIQTVTEIAFSDHVSVINLPSGKLLQETFEKRIATVSGWGLLTAASNYISPVLRTASVTVISNKECDEKYDSEPIFDTTLCGLGANTKSTCQGDSGGPLVVNVDGKLVQIGVVSFGSDSGCDKGFPHGYSRLTKYASWIQAQTGIPLITGS